jgi:hypothetical protein
VPTGVAGAAFRAAAVTDGGGHVRLDAITAAQRRLLAELTGRISSRLAAECEKPLRPESLNVGVTLQERGKAWPPGDPVFAAPGAESDRTARDALPVRIKAARDRMLLRLRPARPRGYRAAKRSGDVEPRELRAGRRARTALSG